MKKQQKGKKERKNYHEMAEQLGAWFELAVNGTDPLVPRPRR
ncbi:MAG: hypothetical protein ACYC7A_21865 [Thermoanaerobaculia bacterium]